MVGPDQNKFDNLRKDDLIVLGKHLKVRSCKRKREMQTTLVEHLVKESIFEQSVLSKYQITDTKTNTAAVEISRHEESEGLDKVETDRQWQREQEDMQWQRKQEEIRWKRKKMELEREREREREERQIKMQEIELQKLELQAQAKDVRQCRARCTHLRF